MQFGFQAYISISSFQIKSSSIATNCFLSDLSEKGSTQRKLGECRDRAYLVEMTRNSGHFGFHIKINYLSYASVSLRDKTALSYAFPDRLFSLADQEANRMWLHDSRSSYLEATLVSSDKVAAVNEKKEKNSSSRYLVKHFSLWHNILRFLETRLVSNILTVPITESIICCKQSDDCKSDDPLAGK